MANFVNRLKESTWFDMVFGSNSVAGTIRVVLMVGFYCVVFSTFFWWLRGYLN